MIDVDNGDNVDSESNVERGESGVVVSFMPGNFIEYVDSSALPIKHKHSQNHCKKEQIQLILMQKLIFQCLLEH